MARQNQETIATFGEVLHSSNISYSQNRSSSNDNRLMIYFQGMRSILGVRLYEIQILPITWLGIIMILILKQENGQLKIL